ncbi:hypothetical protein ABID92_000025 [Frigoribacterium sp. PvP120]|uniref:hypothetical protein n=1 Tax=unclassified Frigoribacterium TaxID=2627005 RepID=UPI001AE744E0|nr:hypothetical protein [Frigoribacterium sp. PvP121]MBP1242148.1 hypothetical protein [Frigoribacterium sp. PvP121]
MTNPVLDQERAEFLVARSRLRKAVLPAWQRANKELDLVELPIDWVRFSTQNHRTRAEQEAEIAKRANANLFSADPLGSLAQSVQYSILRGQAGFQDLKNDLISRGQQEPAVVTAEGVLINGNRRAAALRSMYEDDDEITAKYVQCLVLPSDASGAELIDLETELQIARDFKEEYGWVNEALLVEELFERENLDYARVANRMHREVQVVRSLHEKLQQVHQLVALSSGARQYIDFEANESAFDELAKHIKNKSASEADSVRSVYFLGTMAGVNYRKLRHLRRPDASNLVQEEIQQDPALSKLLKAANLDSSSKPDDPFDDVLGNEETLGSLSPLLSYVAKQSDHGIVELSTGDVFEIKSLLQNLQSAITAVAEEAEEDQRDNQAQLTPIKRMEKALGEARRALDALPKARSFETFDEEAFALKVTELSALLEQYTGR